MEAIASGIRRNPGLTFLLVVLAVIGIAYAYILNLSPDGQKDLLYFVQDFLPIFMFFSLAALLFTGFPVAFILGGLSFVYGILGYLLGMFSLIEFFNFMPRIWFNGAENLVLVSIPAFVFMGVMMERSGVANDLLYCVQVLLKKVPGLHFHERGVRRVHSIEFQRQILHFIEWTREHGWRDQGHQYHAVLQ